MQVTDINNKKEAVTADHRSIKGWRENIINNLHQQIYHIVTQHKYIPFKLFSVKLIHLSFLSNLQFNLLDKFFT